MSKKIVTYFQELSKTVHRWGVAVKIGIIKSGFRYPPLQAEMAELCPGGMMYGEKLVYSFRKIRTGSQGC